MEVHVSAPADLRRAGSSIVVPAAWRPGPPQRSTLHPPRPVSAPADVLARRVTTRTVPGVSIERLHDLPAHGAFSGEPADVVSVVMIEQSHCLVASAGPGMPELALHGPSSLAAAAPGDSTEYRWFGALSPTISVVHVAVDGALAMHALGATTHDALRPLGRLHHRAPAATRAIAVLASLMQRDHRDEEIVAHARALIQHLASGPANAGRDEGLRRTSPGLDFSSVAHLLSHIEERLHERLPVQHLADLVHLSRFHFIRSFTRALGVTPHAFIVERRLERAADLLDRTTLSIGDVIGATGWTSRSHFASAFSSRFGCSPSHYRSGSSTRGEAASALATHPPAPV